MTTINSDQTNKKNTFADLLSDQQIIESLKKLGIIEPTEIQAAALPVATQGKDLIAQAQTGSGKTLAFVLPIVEKIKATGNRRGTQALIITPTRELALQVQNVIHSVAPEFQPVVIIGGASSRAQVKQLKEDARIIVGTPGRLLDLLQQRLIILRTCRTVVLDEADEMLSMGFIEEVRDILGRLPKEKQGMFFSATLSSTVLGLANTFLVRPEQVLIKAKEDETAKIDHLYCRVGAGVASRAEALCQLLLSQGARSAIVFCNTKSDTELAEVVLRRRGFNARRINSDLSQRERESVLGSLRSGELQYLIATDVAARGIDIKDLELVVNYSVHAQPEVYVHRTGRTGRAGASGKAISFVSPQDVVAFKSLQRHLGIEISEMALG